MGLKKNGGMNQNDIDWARDKLAALIRKLTLRAANVLEWSDEIAWLDLYGDWQ